MCIYVGVSVCVWVEFVRGQCVFGFGDVSVFVVGFEGSRCVWLGLGYSLFFSSEKGFIFVAFLHTHVSQLSDSYLVF